MKPIQWIHAPWRNNTRQFYLLLIILLLVLSLMVFWLGLGTLSLALGLAFLFSLRDLLFPTSYRIDEDGFHRSSPLLGGQNIFWEQLHSWRVEEGWLRLQRSPRKQDSWRLKADLDLAQFESEIREFEDFARDLVADPE